MPTLCLFRTLLGATLIASAIPLLGACASRPEAPVIRPLDDSATAATAARLDAILPADILLLGEQHDAPEHQQIQQQVIALLASRGLLAAVGLEMSDAGASTAKLKPSSTEQQAQAALRWDHQAWPWAAYGPAVMTAVRAGVLVLGANLPRLRWPGSMLDNKLDGQLPGPALKAQQQLIRMGHCNLLPESRITPMTRLQIAKDISMASTLSQATVPGKVVVLLSGYGHADRFLGVPQHLSANLDIKSVRLRAGPAEGGDNTGAFDSVWATPALPETDYCAGLQEQLAPRGTAPLPPVLTRP